LFAIISFILHLCEFCASMKHFLLKGVTIFDYVTSKGRRVFMKARDQ
jgi:hypothetical protein